eukprot:GHVO01026901.1.p1 GENE.GHVO01026901.1~~GHVO01026901.1.p1  ORF type:complete len:316 (+),score=46.69 GHVO01026901.1:32-949(+)
MTSTERLTYTPAEGLNIILKKAKTKGTYNWYQLIIWGFMAGFWLALAALSATRSAGLAYFGSDWSPCVANLIYGAIFPSGLMIIIFTGSELYTGNTATMWAFVLEDPLKLRQWLELLKIWSCSFFMNMIGGVFVAVCIAWPSGTFASGSPQDYLFMLAEKKVNYTFWEIFFLAIGCNSIVCATIFTTWITDSMISKIFAVWFMIGTFCWAGYEHVVANFFTLPLGFVVGADITIGGILFNWFASWLGNTIAGAFFCATVWWVTLRKKDEQPKAVSYTPDTSNDSPLSSGSTGRGKAEADAEFDIV